MTELPQVKTNRDSILYNFQTGEVQSLSRLRTDVQKDRTGLSAIAFSDRFLSSDFLSQIPTLIICVVKLNLHPKRRWQVSPAQKRVREQYLFLRQ